MSRVLKLCSCCVPAALLQEKAPAQPTINAPPALNLFQQMLNFLKSCICSCRPRPPPPQPPTIPQDMTLEELDAVLDYLSAQIDALNRGSSDPLPSPLRKLLEWNQRGEKITDFMTSLPDDLKEQAGDVAKRLVMDLLKKALGGVGGVHWIGLGCSFIAWGLDNLKNMSENRQQLLDLLRSAVDLLKRNKSTWQEANKQAGDRDVGVEQLQESARKAFLCALLCATYLKENAIVRFFGGSSTKDAIESLGNQLREAREQIRDFMIERIFKDCVAAIPERKQVTFSANSAIVGRMELKAEALQHYSTAREGDIGIVGVVLSGMGGVGKSTLGMEIFKEFQGPGMPAKHACIRVEVPFEVKEEELPKIQKEMLGKLITSGQAPPEFSNVTDGTEYLKQELEKSKLPLFLYIDNVLKPRHIVDLLPTAPCFPKGSKILVTTRDSSVSGKLTHDLGLPLENVKLIEVKKMEKDEARKLLWRFIKGEGSQVNIHMEEGMSKEEGKVLELCQGLPLALKVVGSYIGTQQSNSGSEQCRGHGAMQVDTLIWRDVASKMKKAKALEGGREDELYHRLNFSITSLDSDEKSAFLDFVAIRAAGHDLAWKHAKCLIYFSNLHKKSLIEKVPKYINGLGEVDALVVHDVLQKMGMQMVEKDKDNVRISSMDGLSELSKDSLGKVVGLFNVTVHAAQLKCMTRLRLLIGVDIEGQSEEALDLKDIVMLRDTSSALRWPADFIKCPNSRIISLDANSAVTDLEVLIIKAYLLCWLVMKP